MIFVTTGTQEPFDRLIKVMDKIASQIDEPIVAQTMLSSYEIKHMQSYQFLSPTDYNQIFNKARLIVSHAGMGTIISALNRNKPIIIMPRQSKHKEHRDDHQLATTGKMKEFNYTYIAMDEGELFDTVHAMIKQENIKPIFPQIGSYASTSLTNSIKEYINRYREE